MLNKDLNWGQSKLNRHIMQRRNDNNHVEYPSRFALNQGVKIYFSTNQYGEINTDTLALNGTVRGVHFYEGKVKYDIELFWTNENGGVHTRIYNVDSLYVVAA